MSVLKMIIADDQHYVSAELHGSRAQWLYAACSRNPRSLDELDQLLPEFGADESLREFFGYNAGLELQPVDAGLIVVDLAKKWIFAEDSYIGAYRRGRYQPRWEEDFTIEYEFPQEWQFVAEAKWFNYLPGCGLKPYGDLPVMASESDDESEDFWDELPERIKRYTEPQFEEGHDDQDDEPWDEERSRLNAVFVNRWTSLIDFNPANAEEERDLKTLEHILKYEEWAAEALHGVKKANKEIASLQIELQAVRNLWKRTGEPRWGLQQIKFEAEIEKRDKRISRREEDSSTHAALAVELRSLLTTEKGRSRLKDWEEEKENQEGVNWDDEIPY